MVPGTSADHTTLGIEPLEAAMNYWKPINRIEPLEALFVLLLVLFPASCTTDVEVYVS